MNNHFVNPDLHVILIHFPIAMLFAGTFIELLAPLFWRNSSFRSAGRWMILVGALAMIPAVTTGMFAAQKAMGHPEMTLAELREHSNLKPEHWPHLTRHILLNGSAAGLLALMVVTWLGASDQLRRKGHIIFLALLLIATSTIAAAAWHGGEMVYTRPSIVGLIERDAPSTQPEPAHEAHEAAPAASPSDDKSKWAFDALNAAGKQLEKVDDAVDLHSMLAGWMVALALATLGISFRVISVHRTQTIDDSMASDDDIITALSGRQGQEKRALMGDQPPPTRAPAPIAPRPGVARFWLLAALLAIGTALLGWMIAAPESMEDVIYTFKNEVRLRAHMIAGVSIVVLTLILSLVTRFAPRNRLLVGGFGLLLALALAAQLWLGVLLIFDTSSGPVIRFNSAPTDQPTHSAPTTAPGLS